MTMEALTVDCWCCATVYLWRVCWYVVNPLVSSSSGTVVVVGVVLLVVLVAPIALGPGGADVGWGPPVGDVFLRRTPHLSVLVMVYPPAWHLRLLLLLLLLKPLLQRLLLLLPLRLKAALLDGA